MPYINYVPKEFRPDTLATIAMARRIVDEYAEQGFDLTLRQLYYQFVSRGLLEENTMRQYKRLGSIVNDARLAGLLDWERIVDRTRQLEAVPHWSTPAGIIRGASKAFRFDKWEEQEVRVEVWIEKDALAGVFERAAHAEDVAYFSCRGYTSQSEMWAAAQRLLRYEEAGQQVIVLHFGDHDPSGLDMTRDIEDRLALFGANVEVRRLALNMDQVRRYNPPPNPAKLTDSRGHSYVRRFGASSWELDALDPTVLADLVRREIRNLRDDELWQEALEREEEARAGLRKAAAKWSEVVDHLDTLEDD